MRLANPASPSFLLIDFRLKGLQRGCLPMPPQFTERQRVRLVGNANEGQQIGIPFVMSRGRPDRQDFPFAFE